MYNFEIWLNATIIARANETLLPCKALQSYLSKWFDYPRPTISRRNMNFCIFPRSIQELNASIKYVSFTLSKCLRVFANRRGAKGRKEQESRTVNKVYPQKLISFGRLRARIDRKIVRRDLRLRIALF